jgi:hypothetical protein
LFLFSLGVSFLHGTEDFSIAYAFFLMLVESLLGATLIYSLYLNRYNFYQLLHYFIIVALIQSFIILVMLFSEGIREFIYSISSLNAEQLMLRYNGFRGFGIASSVTYDLAFFLSITLIFIAFLLSKGSKNRIFYVFSWLIISSAILMTGRTGWIGIGFSLIILVTHFKNKSALRSILLLLLVFVVGVPALLSFLSIFMPLKYEVVINSIVPYALEMFINFYEKGDFSTYSTIAVMDMYFMPPLETLLIGDGYFSNPDGQGYYMNVDAGYLRLVLFFGVFGSLVLYLSYVYMFFRIYRYTEVYKGFKMTVVLLSLSYFIVQWKGVIMSNSSMNIKLVLLLFVFLVFSFYKNKAVNYA